MKKIKAIKSFSGAVTMGKGQVKDVPDKAADDVLNAGLAEEAGGESEPPKKKGGKKNGTKSGDGK